MRQPRPLAVRTFCLLMIARHRNAGDHRIQPGPGAKPLPPFAVGFGVVDEVAGVNHEPGLGSVAVGLPNHPRPHAADIVLGIAEVDEREGAGLSLAVVK